jgi:hypothetical protein
MKIVNQDFVNTVENGIYGNLWVQLDPSNMDAWKHVDSAVWMHTDNAVDSNMLELEVHLKGES